MSFSPTLFQKIITPFWEVVDKEENCPANDSAKKLDFKIFIRILLYYLLGTPDSARSLITDLKDEDCTEACGLISCGLSTLHDAFARYTCELFRQLYLALLLVIPPPGIDEFKQLGQVTLVDSSVFPLSINAYWANFKESANALKMHLYQLEQVRPVELIDSVKLIFFEVTDELVRFNCDEHDKLYRHISFRTRNSLFILVTDRLDLTTFEIIKPYCLRWQIELFFRLINESENGVTIQFYMILIVKAEINFRQRNQF